MACKKFSPFLVATIFGLLVAAQDDLRPLCSIASAQFVAGDTSLFTFEPRGKCTEAQLVFNDSSSVKIDIDGPDCAGFATHHVSLNAATPPGWAEFFLICDDGGLCKNIFIQPKQTNGNSEPPNKILQECLGGTDPVTTISLEPSLRTEPTSPSMTQSVVDNINTYTATAPETYTMIESTGTAQAIIETATAPDTYTMGSQSTGTTQSIIDNFNTYTATAPNAYPIGSQSISISSYAGITSTTNICSCCTSI